MTRSDLIPSGNVQGPGEGKPPEEPDPLRGARLPALLGAYFLLHLFIRLLVSDTLALDEAEQVLVSQSFQWGYSGQPPLYAWLQHLTFLVLGRNLLALAFLKNALLYLAYLCFWLTGRRLWPRAPALRTVATLSWFLIPQIVWEAQRDLSHSVMVLTMASGSLYLVARALTPGGPRGHRRRPGTIWYLAYGFLMGLGMLSKYNFLVFAGALNLALLSFPEGRAILLRPRVLVALSMAALVSLPHFHWAASHWDVALRSLGKVDASVNNSRLAGLGLLLLASVSFLTPLWLAWLGFFPGLFKGRDARSRTPLHGLLQRYLVVLLAGLALGILLLGIGHVKERWMIPFLFLVPLYFFAGAEDDLLGREGWVRRGVWFRRVAMAAGLATLLAAGGRAVIGFRLGATTRINYPFSQMARALPAQASHGGILLAHNTWFAGNLLKRLPLGQAFVPGYVLPVPRPGLPVLVVWDADRRPEMPEEVREDLMDRFGVDLERAPAADREPSYLTFPYKHGGGRMARAGYLLLDESLRR